MLEERLIEGKIIKNPFAKEPEYLISKIVKCTCSCHENNMIMHMMPCCDKDGMCTTYVPYEKED